MKIEVHEYEKVISSNKLLGSSLVFSRGMRKDIFYVLMYQVMVMPIFDIYHFAVSSVILTKLLL